MQPKVFGHLNTAQTWLLGILIQNLQDLFLLNSLFNKTLETCSSVMMAFFQRISTNMKDFVLLIDGYYPEKLKLR